MKIERHFQFFLCVVVVRHLALIETGVVQARVDNLKPSPVEAVGLGNSSHLQAPVFCPLSMDGGEPWVPGVPNCSNSEDCQVSRADPRDLKQLMKPEETSPSPLARPSCEPGSKGKLSGRLTSLRWCCCCPPPQEELQPSSAPPSDAQTLQSCTTLQWQQLHKLFISISRNCVYCVPYFTNYVLFSSF